MNAGKTIKNKKPVRIILFVDFFITSAPFFKNAVRLRPVHFRRRHWWHIRQKAHHLYSLPQFTHSIKVRRFIGKAAAFIFMFKRPCFGRNFNREVKEAEDDKLKYFLYLFYFFDHWFFDD
jgi:hypothetical protein